MAITNAVDVAALNGNFKEVYADKIVDLIPEGLKAMTMFKFVMGDKQLGNKYHQAVVLTTSQGFSYGGTDGTAFDLTDAIPMSTKDATVQGYEFVLRDLLSVAAASRSQTGQNAFVQATKLLVETMYKSFARRLESMALYGQSNIGVVASGSGSDLVISAAEWAPGIYSGVENAQIQFHDATAGAMITGVAKIVSVNIETRTLTLSNVSGTPIADVIAALPNVIEIHFKGARVDTTTFNEFAGVHKIVSNIGSLFGINAANYSLWKGTQLDCAAAAISLDLIESGVAKSMAKGLGEEELVLLCSPMTWRKLLAEMTAKRRFDSSYSSAKLEDGAKAIQFHTPNGLIRIEASIYIKEGYAYLIPPKEFIRVGSSDITFAQPGRGKDEFFKLLENANGYELRCYTDQALFTARPGICVLFKNFSN